MEANDRRRILCPVCSHDKVWPLVYVNQFVPISLSHLLVGLTRAVKPESEDWDGRVENALLARKH